MSEVQIHRQLGRLEAQVEALERRAEAADERAERMAGQVSAMHDVLMQAKGGWRAMVMVGSVSAAVGALAAKLLALIHWR